jgi:hypothetical protein
MGAKKKVEVPQPPPQAPQEKVVHNVYLFRCNDGEEFKLAEEQITKYSPRLRSLVEATKEETVVLEEVEGRQFEVVVDFINLHREKEPAKIAAPMRTNQTLNFAMEEGDAELVERVMGRGDQFVWKMLDLAQWLEMEALRKRLACGVALQLMRSTLEELKEEYGLEKETFNEDELKSEMRPVIDALKHIADEEQ